MTASRRCSSPAEGSGVIGLAPAEVWSRNALTRQRVVAAVGLPVLKLWYRLGRRQAAAVR